MSFEQVANIITPSGQIQQVQLATPMNQLQGRTSLFEIKKKENLSDFCDTFKLQQFLKKKKRNFSDNLKIVHYFLNFYQIVIFIKS